MNNLRKNIILSSLSLFFGIFIISFFSYLVTDMDAPLWEDLSNSLMVFIPIISGFLLLYSTYSIIKKKPVKKNFSYIYWILSIPSFFYFFLLFWIFYQSSYFHLYDLMKILSIGSFFFIFSFSGSLILYLGIRIYKEKKLFFSVSSF